MGHERIGGAAPDLDRLVDQVVSLGDLLGDGVDGVLKDLTLASRPRMLVAGADVGSVPDGPTPSISTPAAAQIDR